MSVKIAAVAIGAILIGLHACMLQRMDAIPSALQRMTDTLAAAHIAAKQQPAIIVIAPVPQTPAAAK